MNKKSVRKIVAAKMDSWLLSINDNRLRDRVRDNLMVSGGCIASLLLNEPVNDYDVYIQDIECFVRFSDVLLP